MMKILVTVCFVLSFFILSSGCSESHVAKTQDQWIDLFNGENLDGWAVKITGHEPGDNYKDTYRVEDGILKVSYDKYKKFDGKFGNLFYEIPFSNYILKTEYRFVGDQLAGGPSWAFRNSGVMIHSQSPESMSIDQKFPVSIEVQMLGGDGSKKRSNGNLCTPGTNVVMNATLVKRHCISSDSETFHGDQWVTLEVEVHGNSLIKHIINGAVVMEYSQPQLDERDKDAKKLIEENGGVMLDKGYIALQAESHPVEFRKVQILHLNE
jgi:hypothetical protein